MFDNISIIGRIAYGICCLESCILTFGFPKNEWKIVFSWLWSIDKVKYIDDWTYAAIECLPECILEFSTYDSDWQYINEYVYKHLHKLYSNCPKKDEINEVLYCISEICGCHLYTGVTKPATDSLCVLNNELIPLLKKINVPLPNIEYFKKFTIDENHCWGANISRNMIDIPYEFA